MAEISSKINYDSEEDILNISKGKGSRASIEVGEFIIDVDSNGFVSALEILNASENLGIEKKLLNKVKKAKLSILYKPNYLLVWISFNFKGIEKEIRIPLTIDLGHKKIERQELVVCWKLGVVKIKLKYISYNINGYKWKTTSKIMNLENITFGEMDEKLKKEIKEIIPKLGFTFSATNNKIEVTKSSSDNRFILKFGFVESFKPSKDLENFELYANDPYGNNRRIKMIFDYDKKQFEAYCIV